MQPVIETVLRAVKKNLVWFGVGMVMAAVILPPTIYGLFCLSYKNRIYPGVKVAGLDVGGLNASEALELVEKNETEYVDIVGGLDLIVMKPATSLGVMEYRVEFGDLGLEYQPSTTTALAMNYGRSKDIVMNLNNQWRALKNGLDIDHLYQFNVASWSARLAEVSDEVDSPGVEPSVSLVEGKVGRERIEVFVGEDGLSLDKDLITGMLREKLAGLDKSPITVTLTEVDWKIDENQVSNVVSRAERLLDRKIQLGLFLGERLDEKTWVLKDTDLVPLIKVEGGYDEERIIDYVEGLAKGVNRPPQNALFKYENEKVVEFAPGLNGVEVDVSRSARVMMEVLGELERTGEDQSMNVVAVLAAPDLATPDVNDLGIRELLGKGESTYRGSIAGRVHNVALTASRLNGVLVPPGEVFSFNKTVGDISAATGYKSAYIIKDGRTVLGDGGGVCQDSTTLFRAVMDAGLPVTERQAHAYRVSYYEQNSKPGFDATVYSPSPDLKFENNTPAHILIQARADTARMYMVIELYGTSDGREAEIVNYQQWGAVPAPPPLYQDDPTLPAGEIKQVDWAASGLKVKFDYVVTRDGGVIFEKTFVSNYRPWQAVYLRGVEG